MLGVALNEVFVPILLQKQFPEIVDFYLPPEGCSYRMAVVSIRKQYPGHAKRVMFGIWSFLRQFMYTKFIIVVDDDIEYPRLEGSDLGALHPRRRGARYADRRKHADRLPRFRQPGRRAGQQDGHRRDQQVAGRNQPRVGNADRHGRRGEAARRRAVVGDKPPAPVEQAKPKTASRARKAAPKKK
jgi:hypothetical protein